GTGAEKEDGDEVEEDEEGAGVGKGHILPEQGGTRDSREAAFAMARWSREPSSTHGYGVGMAGINPPGQRRTGGLETLGTVTGAVSSPAGLGSMLSIVARAVRAVRQRNKTGLLSRERGTMNQEGPREHERSREASGRAQRVVGALAKAVLGAFEAHMADPSLHLQLRVPGDGGGGEKDRRLSSVDSDHVGVAG
ncbi:unnamed protein product, partial [Choristocarpus tenellus]